MHGHCGGFAIIASTQASNNYCFICHKGLVKDHEVI